MEKLEAALAWRREAENAALANVWHLETVASLAGELRRLLEQAETDEALIQLLWENIPGDNRSEVRDALRAPGAKFPLGETRLATILERLTP